MHPTLRAERHRVSHCLVDGLMRWHGVQKLARCRSRLTTADDPQSLPLVTTVL
jgi:hypothetical protein